MRYLSLFSGVGGFELGIQQAYEDYKIGGNSSDCNEEEQRDPKGDKSIPKRQKENESQKTINDVEDTKDSSGALLQNRQMQSDTKPKDLDESKKDNEPRRNLGQDGDGVLPKGSNLRDREKVLQHKGDKPNSGSELKQPVCIGYSEIDKYAIQVYNKHFNHKNYGDITKINEKELPDFDFLCGGFPCQSFSIAGKRGGFEDTRGTLFFDIARILREKQPGLLLLENVKGLLSHDEGKTFRTIISTLDELGYDCQWQVLNSKNFGVPQNRERVFIIGHLRGTSRPEVFPIGEATEKVIKTKFPNIPEIGEANRIYKTEGISPPTKPHHILIEQLNKPKHSNDRVYSDKGLSLTLNTMQGGNRQPFVAMRWNRTEKGRKLRREAQKTGRDYTPFNDGCRTLEPAKDDIIGTITSQAIAKDSLLGAGSKIRRLTPKECERLQGFPDDWTKEGVEGLISDTQRYKMCGNAVTVNVIKEIIKKFL